ncbi:MAG: hypothetical protein LBG76_00865 [Treponema sp.]|jgi:hypothetical protein|nr:hypothetical protein [Treponema sp.]
MRRYEGAVFATLIAFGAFFFAGCDYGVLGGADITGTYYPGDAEFVERLDFMSGVWYSHYAGIGRLDGYRIGKWEDFDAWGKDKARALFPRFDAANVRSCKSQDTPAPGDYILLYDDTAYGMQDETSVPQESWGFAYMGVARAVNIFNGDKKRGAIIIEYFEGCDPPWLWDSGRGGYYQGLRQGEKPFFGIYYRVLQPDIVQMANAVDLAALYNGSPYYTEKETLEEAVEANGVENEAEFISWGVVIPQDREKP